MGPARVVGAEAASLLAELIRIPSVNPSLGPAGAGEGGEQAIAEFARGWLADRGLRSWLEAHDALPDAPLVAMVPVSIRTGAESEKWTNRVSGIVASLPTDEPDPVAGVARVHESMVGAKSLFDAVPADALTDFAQFPPPAVFARAMRTATRLTGRFSSPVNVVISNVPGPRDPLYAAGARLLHYYPVSTIVDGQGLNVTVQSYLDSLDFGLVACRELVPDLPVMLDAIVDDLAALGKATGVDVSL